MSDSDIKKLTEPFPQNAIKWRKGGGGRDLAYLEGHTIIHRLNDATGNQWSLELRALETMQLGSKTLLRAHVALTLPGLGTREHIGIQMVDERGGEDLVKGAVTDALKKAATLFGVGLELFGPDYEAGEISDAPPRTRGTSQNTAPNVPQGREANVPGEKVSEHPSDVQLISQGQINVITKHQGDLGWSNDDMRLIVAGHNHKLIKEFSALEGRDLIYVMADPNRADAYLSATKNPAAAQQAEMIPTTDVAERARQ